MNDPAVRSVRVAVALCDRFAELLKGPTKVTARKQHGALLGVAGNESELSLRIGEAQQIYPEIWRHLDEARAGFSAQGIDTTGYDKLRSDEGNRLGAAVDTRSQTHGFGQHAIVENTKSANFNATGLARARLACETLMKTTPHVDWAAIAMAEANDPAAAAFGRSTKMRRYLSLALLILVLASPFLYVMWTRHQERVKRERARQQWEQQHRF
jgi:hypothetical protein